MTRTVDKKGIVRVTISVAEILALPRSPRDPSYWDWLQYAHPSALVLARERVANVCHAEARWWLDYFHAQVADGILTHDIVAAMEWERIANLLERGAEIVQ